MAWAYLISRPGAREIQFCLTSLMLDAKELELQIREALKMFAFDRVTELCGELISTLPCRSTFDEKSSARILHALRRKRRFELMERVALAFLAHQHRTPEVRLYYIQSLLDQNKLEGAGCEAKRAIDELSVEKHRTEARGLLGRAHKQRYINNTSAPDAAAWLQTSFDTYLKAYEDDGELTWHGVNALALLEHGRRNNILLANAPDPLKLAESILETIDGREADGRLGHWDFANAMEASLALRGDQYTRIFDWAQRYVSSDGADAFEFAATVRQLRGIWQLDRSSDPRFERVLLPLLHAAQLRHEGGGVPLDEIMAARASGDRIHQAFLDDKQSMQAFEWMLRAISRGRTVAHIDDAIGNRVGTGFLVHGRDFGRKEEYLLMTNAHVLGEQKPQTGVDRVHAKVSFTKLEPRVDQLEVDEIVFENPELDVCIATLKPGLPGGIKCPELGTCENLRHEDPRSRVFVIGHPGADNLKYSLYDNYFVKSSTHLLYYRSPTEKGNSGSPLFDESWDLVGVHHSFDPKESANCGTQIDRIKERLHEQQKAAK